MVKTTTLLLSLACAFAVVQSTTPDPTVHFPALVQVRRRLKGTGGHGGGGGHGGTSGGHPSGGTSGGHPSGGTSGGGHPSDGTSTTTGGAGVIVVGGGGGYYHNNYNSGSTETPSPTMLGTSGTTPSTGSQAVSGSMVSDPDVFVAAPDVMLPTSAATNSATTLVLGAVTLVLVVANAV